jgi:hypothetical protein
MNNESPTDDESIGMSEVEQLKNELAAVKEEFHAYRKAVSKKFSSHEDELEEIEARFEEESPVGEADESGSADDDLLPIERIARLKDDDEPEDNPFADTTPSVDRAVVLYENFRSWSDKAPKGRVIRSGLKKLLNTAMDTQLSWKQIYRACRELEEWSKGRIVFKKTSRHGWILVEGDERSSSASGG